MEILESRNGIDIVRLHSSEDAKPYRASFVGSYQTIFADPPYNERFFPSEAEAVIYKNLQTPEHITLLCVQDELVVGFGFAVPVHSRSAVIQKLRGLIPVSNSFYLAELGILEQYRRRGLGRALTEHRLRLINAQKYSYAVLRTSVVKDSSYRMFLNMQFEDMGVYTEVSSRRTDGKVRTDRRLYLTRMLEST
ncbi:MAG: GNAT family N-acetyltransferase [Myxococcota bacterium]|nr:GNAT family N-acetyltransferase [Myxococcota bacterium]